MENYNSLGDFVKRNKDGIDWKEILDLGSYIKEYRDGIDWSLCNLEKISLSEKFIEIYKDNINCEKI